MVANIPPSTRRSQAQITGSNWQPAWPAWPAWPALLVSNGFRTSKCLSLNHGFTKILCALEALASTRSCRYPRIVLSEQCLMCWVKPEVQGGAKVLCKQCVKNDAARKCICLDRIDWIKADSCASPGFCSLWFTFSKACQWFVVCQNLPKFRSLSPGFRPGRRRNHFRGASGRHRRQTNENYLQKTRHFVKGYCLVTSALICCLLTCGCIQHLYSFLSSISEKRWPKSDFLGVLAIFCQDFAESFKPLERCRKLCHTPALAKQ